MKEVLFYGILFILSFGLTYVARRIAIKKSFLDIPTERSSHEIPTPRGGGIAVVIAWYLGIGYFYFTKNINPNLFFALLSGLLIALISLLDDIIKLSPFVRLIVQAIASSIALFFIGGLEKIDIGFLIWENNIILTIFAFIGIIWFTNLFNFLDGIDGYIGTEIIFISLSIFIFFSDPLLLILAFCVFGFLLWNWEKAKIFMGDVGSTLLGFNIAVFAIYYQNLGDSSILVWLMLSSVFWFDATLTIFRRLKNRENISMAHKKHAYQRIVQAGFSHQNTVLYSILLNIICFFLAYLSLRLPYLILLFFLINMIILYLVVKYIDKRKPFY